MEKENKRLKLLSKILLVIVVILGSYIVYDKLMGEGTNTEKAEENVEKDFDLDAAEQLLSIYSGILSYREYEQESQKEGAEEAYKAMLAFNFTRNAVIKSVDYSLSSCESIADHDFCSSTNSWTYGQYDDINETYKYLFGSNLSLEKKNYSTMRGTQLLQYYEKGDHYVRATLNSSGYPIIGVYKIIGAKVSGEELKINVAYSKLETQNWEYGKSPYTDKTYKWSEKQNFIDEELQYFDEYNFIFENENGHYIFKDVVKTLDK